MEHSEIIRNLKSVMSMKGWTQHRVALELECDQGCVSKLLSGKYPSNVLYERVEEFLIELSKKAPEGKMIIATNTQTQIMEMCHDCLQFHKLGIVIGDPGKGKTVNLEEAALNYDKVKYVCANSYSTMHELTDRVLEGKAVGSAAHRIEQCKEHLKDWLLILDELDRVSVRTIEGFRAILDAGNVGMVMAGTKLFQKMLMRPLGHPDSLAHLYDRASFVLNLNNPSDDDIARYLTAQGITDQEARKMSRDAMKAGSFRQGANDIWQAKRLANVNAELVDGNLVDIPVDAKVLRTARLMRTFGKEY